jgi:hypothetical protein
VVISTCRAKDPTIPSQGCNSENIEIQTENAFLKTVKILDYPVDQGEKRDLC